jgi:peptidoglycan/xylan/chitin deacetylase (PgdA/CDA1 family)
MRVKTVWFRKDAARAPDEIATVAASTLWRLADKLTDNLSRADYDIITPARGFRIIAEVLAFGIHACDRMAYGRVAAPQRAALIQALGARLGEILEQNVRPLTGPDGRDYRAEFVEMVNRRADDYATFEFPDSGASFPALRYLGAQIREVMEERDRHWVMNQVMEIEMPEVLGTLKKTMDGLLPSVPDVALRPNAAARSHQ